MHLKIPRKDPSDKIFFLSIIYEDYFRRKQLKLVSGKTIIQISCILQPVLRTMGKISRLLSKAFIEPTL